MNKNVMVTCAISGGADNCGRNPNIPVTTEQVAKDARVLQLEARLMDAENLTLPNASFDAVICRLGLMYFPTLRRALNEARRVLRPRWQPWMQ